MFLKKPKYRQFVYEPRYYKPDLDESGRLKEKLRQERIKRRKKARPPFIWAVLLLVLLYAYLYLSGNLR